MYLQDHGNRFFPDQTTKPWNQLLGAYCDGNSSYDCPTSKHSGKANDPDYGFNANLFSQPLKTITKPTAELLTADIVAPSPSANHAFTTTDPAAASYYGTAIDPRHNRGVVCAFADGHAALLTSQLDETVVDMLKRHYVILGVK
jgi:prepilin-type processing-associated H-X9-DG protein